MKTKLPAAEVHQLRPFLSLPQLAAIGEGCRGEDSDWFRVKIIELAALLQTMPTTGKTDGQGDLAVAWLHYFTPSSDFYITETDAGSPDDLKNGIPAQSQAFGLACVFEEELGYISLPEITAAGAELDLYWTPKTLAEIKAARRETVTPTPHGLPVSNRAGVFSAELESLLAAIRKAATNQFEYNETQNLPRCILSPAESVPHAILQGFVSGWNNRNGWDCQRAIAAAHDLLEDANCHTEAARLRAA